MLDLIDPLIALVTIAFGLFGLVAPRYAAGTLDMRPVDSTMGLSQIGASAGGCSSLWQGLHACRRGLGPAAIAGLERGFAPRYIWRVPATGLWA